MNRFKKLSKTNEDLSEFLEGIYQAYRHHTNADPKAPENLRMVISSFFLAGGIGECLTYQEKFAKSGWCIWNEPFSIGTCCFPSVQKGTTTEKRRCKMKHHFFGRRSPLGMEKRLPQAKTNEETQ